jgi:hypothetical protein
MVPIPKVPVDHRLQPVATIVCRSLVLLLGPQAHACAYDKPPSWRCQAFLLELYASTSA